MVDFDCLIIGGGVSSVSCALLLGSARNKPFAADKHLGIIMHQRSSSLQRAVFNNAYGIAPGTLGADLLVQSQVHLEQQYPHVVQILGEKVLQIHNNQDFFEVVSNKATYRAKIVVVGIGSSSPFLIEGLEEFVIPHPKAMASKNRIALRNNDHLVFPGMYVCGTLAGHRSQLSIAAGSGASVAGDILTYWNEGIPTQIHDAVPNEL